MEHLIECRMESLLTELNELENKIYEQIDSIEKSIVNNPTNFKYTNNDFDNNIQNIGILLYSDEFDKISLYRNKYNIDCNPKNSDASFIGTFSKIFSPDFQKETIQTKQ